MLLNSMWVCQYNPRDRNIKLSVSFHLIGLPIRGSEDLTLPSKLELRGYMIGSRKKLRCIVGETWSQKRT